MSRPFVVLQSFPRPRPTTNPYLIMLGQSLAEMPDVVLLNFSWRTALTSRYDVFHAHWPEILVSGHSPLKKLARQGLFVLLLLKLRLTRTPIVRTMHNLELPQGISRREIALLKLFDRQTTLRISLNTSTDFPAGQPVEIIVHGHYSGWFSSYQKSEPTAGRLAYFGLIRRYKNVEALIRAFRAVDEGADQLSLIVAGKPSSDELADGLRAEAGNDPRISFELHFLTDQELVTTVTAAELVVLPYREMHNSGGALSTLSLHRPVLVPDNEVNRKLAAEVGTGWVYLYAGELEAADLTSTLAALHDEPRSSAPDLSVRDWDKAGTDHLRAYRRAKELLRRR